MKYADCNCTYVENYNPRTYTFTGFCTVTGRQVSVTVKAEELNAYRRGALLQDAFRSLDADDREFLLTGVSKDGWSELFGEDS